MAYSQAVLSKSKTINFGTADNSEDLAALLFRDFGLAGMDWNESVGTNRQSHRTKVATFMVILLCANSGGSWLLKFNVIDVNGERTTNHVGVGWQKSSHFSQKTSFICDIGETAKREKVAVGCRMVDTVQGRTYY